MRRRLRFRLQWRAIVMLALIWVVLALKIALVALPEWRRKVFTVIRYGK